MAKKRTSSHSEPGEWASLAEFQSGGGVALKDQILLIENSRIFRKSTPVSNPYSKSDRFSSFLYKAISILGGRRRGEGLYLPKRNNRVFLGFFDQSLDDPISALASLFGLMEVCPEREFCLIIGKGDYIVTERWTELFPKNLKVLIANNKNVEHPVVHYLPMGRDFRNRQLLADFPPANDKEILCYCNFSIDTHPQREKLYENIKDKPFLTVDHMGEFLSYSISRREFLRKLRLSKFCVCPRGNAIDTFRLWDCLYLGTIPIVVREAKFHDDLQDLPILFLDDYSQFADLSAEYLEQVYDTFLETQYNYSKLSISHWLKD